VAFWGRVRRRGGPPRDVAAALRRALLSALDGELEAAEAELAAALRETPTDTELCLALARVQRERGQVGRAVHLHQALLLRRHVPAECRFEALRGLAEDFRAGGSARRAIAAYEEVRAERPDDARALRALVDLLAGAGEPLRALPLARRLARREGRPPGREAARLWVQAAEAERALGDTEAARKALRRALRLDRDCVSAWLGLGEVESELGRTRRAVAAWQRAAELDRRAGARVYARLAAGLAALGRPHEHETFLRALLETRPDDAPACVALAEALAARGAADEARAELRRGIEREPDALALRAALGRHLLAEGRLPELAKACEELLHVLERGGAARGDAAEDAIA
jgi:lipopolysaccharide biosynthesis regulator YciM